MLDRPCLVRTFSGRPAGLGRAEAGWFVGRDSQRSRMLLEGWRRLTDDLARGDEAARARLVEGDAVLETLRRLDPDLAEEHRGLAEALGFRPGVVASYWARRTPSPEPAGCTLFAVAAKGGGTLVGRNFDLRVEDIDRRLLIVRPPPKSSSTITRACGSRGGPRSGPSIAAWPCGSSWIPAPPWNRRCG